MRTAVQIWPDAQKSFNININLHTRQLQCNDLATYNTTEQNIYGKHWG